MQSDPSGRDHTVDTAEPTFNQASISEAATLVVEKKVAGASKSDDHHRQDRSESHPRIAP
jgi:hypothetical protein